MNLTNYEKTAILRVFDAVKREANVRRQCPRERDRRTGTPHRVVDVSLATLQLTQFKKDQILEARLREGAGEVEKLKKWKVEK